MKLSCLLGKHKWNIKYSRYKIIGDTSWYVRRKTCSICGKEEIDYETVSVRSMWEFEKERGIK